MQISKLVVRNFWFLSQNRKFRNIPEISPSRRVYYTCKDDVKVFLFFRYKEGFQQAGQQLRHQQHQEPLVEEF